MKSTNDKIDQVLFKLRTTHEVEHNDNKWTTEFVYSIDETRQEIAKLIKETLQECLGENEPEEEFTKSGVNLAVVKGNTVRNQLRKEALNKLDSLLGENNESNTKNSGM